MADAETKWVPEHFIGGHPALDLANAVFNRRVPEADNELLEDASDLGEDEDDVAEVIENVDEGGEER